MLERLKWRGRRQNMSALSVAALDIEDLRRLARRRLPKSLFDFIDRGSEDEIALHRNAEAIRRITLRTRVLNDVSQRSPATSLLGVQQNLPVVIAPTGPTGYVWYRGEIALARAAAKAGIPFTVASTSNTAMETILKEGGGRQWYQLYVWRDLETSMKTVLRARDAGFEALVLTVDSVVEYNRKWDARNGAAFPVRFTARNVWDAAMHPRWLGGTMGRYLRAERGLPRYVNIPALDNVPLSQARTHLVKNDTMTWDVLRRLRDLWPRKLVVKGILHPADELIAHECGADAVVVSNHGGIANDSAPAPIEVLPAVVAAAGKHLSVIVDSGFRRGSDVLKALALGADAVMLGRAPLYGLAAAGEAGATRALDILRAEIRRTMGAIGCVDIPSVTRDHVLLPSDIERGFDGEPNVDERNRIGGARR
jgi:isopentenyl diphosphate isomerase/L-lactate dehydrogenase-like FMN-dependent dehydrogenase